MSLRFVKSLMCVAIAVLALACEDDDPDNTPTGGAGGEVGGAGGEIVGGAGGEVVGGEGGEGGVGGEGGEGGVGGEGGAVLACEPGADAYPGDTWDACISDNGRWDLAGASAPSSIGRVAAYETIASLLLTGVPEDQDFVDAQFAYAEEEGLGSRVVRRYDAHVAKPEGADCALETAAEQWPEYCVGPAALQPTILAALDAGAQGQEPVLNAARVDAALMWFFYLSPYKEAKTCASKAADCDSAWAYYNGGRQLDEVQLGFAARVLAEDPIAHAAIFEALLAVRCWRDLDQAETSENPELMNRALALLDPALDRALAVVLAARATQLESETGDAQAASFEFLKILGPVIDRAARARDAAAADALLAAFNGTLDAFDGEAVAAQLDALFPCAYL